MPNCDTGMHGCSWIGCASRKCAAIPLSCSPGACAGRTTTGIVLRWRNFSTKRRRAHRRSNSVSADTNKCIGPSRCAGQRNDAMKRVLQVLLALIAVLVLTYYFLVDVLLKKAIEREGSKALQAELNIGSVNFRLFPLGIVLNDMQATNPQQPLRNLVTAERVAATFTIAQILDHKIVVDDMQLNGLRFNQARLRSGAIPGLAPEPKPVLTAAGLPGLSLPDPDALLAAEKTLVQTELRKLRDDLTQTRDSWQQRLLTLPD